MSYERHWHLTTPPVGHLTTPPFGHPSEGGDWGGEWD